jgi:hypothetical protein
VTGAVLIAAGAPAVTHWSSDLGFGQAAALSHSSDPLALNLDAAPSLTGHQATKGRHHARPSARSAKAAPQLGAPAHTPAPAPAQTPAPKGKHHRRHHHHVAPPVVYANPLRSISGLVPERDDMGVDFSGTGPIYAIGDGVVTDVYNGTAAWPGGGWVSYRLTDGPAAGLTVYVAEDVTPTVSVGQTVTPDTVICNMFQGYDGIETGWAWAGYGDTAEASSPAAGGVGYFPTQLGVNFDELLIALGVPAAPNRYESPSGLLPAGYSTDWAGALG